MDKERYWRRDPYNIEPTWTLIREPDVWFAIAEDKTIEFDTTIGGETSEFHSLTIEEFKTAYQIISLYIEGKLDE